MNSAPRKRNRQLLRHRIWDRPGTLKPKRSAVEQLSRRLLQRARRVNDSMSEQSEPGVERSVEKRPSLRNESGVQPEQHKTSIPNHSYLFLSFSFSESQAQSRSRPWQQRQRAQGRFIVTSSVPRVASWATCTILQGHIRSKATRAHHQGRRAGSTWPGQLRALECGTLCSADFFWGLSIINRICWRHLKTVLWLLWLKSYNRFPESVEAWWAAQTEKLIGVSAKLEKSLTPNGAK